jgi:chemotaxis response regulator CheB
MRKERQPYEAVVIGTSAGGLSTAVDLILPLDEISAHLARLTSGTAE